MSDRRKDSGELDVAEVSALGGGKVLVSDPSRVPAEAELNENEMDADFDREDDGLLDSGSPEFDHSLRRRKA